MKKFLLNQYGMGLMQMLLLGTAVAGAGAYMMTTMQEQKKVSKSAATKGIYSVIRRELAETMADGDSCLNTFKQGVDNPVTGSFEVPSLNNKDGVVLYDKVTSLHGHKIKNFDFQLPSDYVQNPALHYQYADFAVTLESEGKGNRTIKLEIPLYTIMLDNKLITCISNDSGSIVDVLSLACQALGGTYDSASGSCKDLTGPKSMVSQYVKSKLCSLNGTSCDTHPYADQSCIGPQYTDSRGVGHDNWVLKGFANDGSKICQCVPVHMCPNPALYCTNTDLGTDWCQNDCGFGSKTDGSCTPCNETSWEPSAANQCAGKTFTQTSNCGTVRNNQVGTMAEIYSPAADTVCAGEIFDQNSNCGNTKTGQVGTKDCSCKNIARPKTWSQTISSITYNCSEGGAATTTTIENKETLMVSTPAGAANSGNAEFYCDGGTLVNPKSICNAVPKTLICNIFYETNMDGPIVSQASNGMWTKNLLVGNNEGCNGGCGMRVGVNCPGSDADVRLSYTFRTAQYWGNAASTQWTDGTDTVKWGPYSTKSHGESDECDASPYGCGLKISAETQGGGTCTVTYSYRTKNKLSPAGTNGSVSAVKDQSSSACEGGNGCGMMAKIDCSI